MTKSQFLRVLVLVNIVLYLVIGGIVIQPDHKNTNSTSTESQSVDSPVDRASAESNHHNDVALAFRDGEQLPSISVRNTRLNNANPRQVTLEFMPDSSEAERLDYLASFNGQIIREIDALNTMIVYLPDNVTIDSLPESSIVSESESNFYLTALADFSVDDPLSSQQWGIPLVNAPAAWTATLLDSAMITIAVIDSGVNIKHEDLAGRIVPGWDFIDNDPLAEDSAGHGTAVSGVIVANSNNGIGIAGLSPNVVIMPLRVLDSDGFGTYFDVADALVYAADNGATIANLSLGGTQESAILLNAVNYAVSHGVTIVASAGNSGSEQVMFPAGYAPVVAVGSIDEDSQISNFSSHGTGIDLYAPGSHIMSTSSDGSYDSFSGTSLAAPFVSAIAALEISHGSELVQNGGIVRFNGTGLPAPNPTPVPDESPDSVDIDSDVLAALKRDGNAQVVINLRSSVNALSDVPVDVLAAATSDIQTQVLDTLPDNTLIVRNLLPVSPSIAAMLSADGLEAVRNHPDIVSVHLDMPTRAHIDGVPTEPRDAIDLTPLDPTLTGEGVRVAVLDTGIDTDHPAFASPNNSRVSAFCLAELLCTRDNSVEDTHSHGTNVAGIIGGNDPVELYAGIAPAVEILSYRVLDDNQEGSTSDWVTTIEKMYLDDVDVDIVNLSLGTLEIVGGTCDAAFGRVFPRAVEAINTMTANGVIFIASSGNQGNQYFDTSGNPAYVQGVNAPACLANVLSVGATYPTNTGFAPLENGLPSSYTSSGADCSDAVTGETTLACFSNRGLNLDVAAPGFNILGPIVPGALPIPANVEYAGYTGTSQAAPIVSGLVALMRQSNPELDFFSVRQILRETGTSVRVNDDNPISDIRLVNPAGAISAIDNSFCSNITGISLSECASLLSFFNRSNGDGWTQNFGWATTNTPCSWFGITCDGGHVTELNLSNNHVVGVFPDAIGGLVHLQNLDLSDNLINGLPGHLGNLVRLQSLNLSNNPLNAPLPPEIGFLSQIQDITIQNAGLIGEIPATFAGLDSLETLDLSDNPASGGQFPAFLSSNLQELKLSNIGMTGIVPPAIGNFTQLQTLDVSENALGGMLPPEISSLLNLQSLSLNDNQLTGSLFAPANTTVLNADNNAFTDFDLTSMPALQVLMLGNNQIAGTLISNTGNLEVLLLSNNNIAGAIPGNWTGTNLRILHLDNNFLAGDIPLNFATMPDLGLAPTVSLPELDSLQALNLNYNLLEANDTTVHTFIESFPSSGLDTQTIPPDITIDATSLNSITIRVSPIVFNSGPGRYEIRVTTSDGTPVEFINTDNKNFSISTVMGLAPGETYLVSARTISLIAGGLLHDLTSAYGNGEFSQTNPTIECNVAPIPVEECEALASIYYATGGAGWVNHDGWDLLLTRDANSTTPANETVGSLSTIAVTTNAMTTLNDSECSLIEAIENANNNASTHPDCTAGNGADVISLDEGSYTLDSIYRTDVVTGATGLPAITDTLTINGTGSTAINRASIENNNDFAKIDFAINNSELPSFVYVDRTTGALMFTYCETTDCSQKVVQRIDNVITNPELASPDIAINSQGNAVIAYYDSANNDLKVAACNNAYCDSPTITVVDNDSGEEPAIAIKSNDFPVIAHVNTAGEIRLTMCNTVTCNDISSTRVFSSFVDQPAPSLALTSDDRPVFSYAGRTGTELAPFLEIFYCEDTNCDNNLSVIFDEEYLAIDLSLTLDDYPVVVYRTNFDIINYLLCDDSCLATSLVSSINQLDTNKPDTEVTLVMRNDDIPLITYVDTANENGIFALCFDVACDGAFPPFPFVVATFTQNTIQLALTDNNIPLTAFSETIPPETASDVIYTRCGDEFCLVNDVTKIIAGEATNEQFFRLFHVANGASLNLENVTLNNGNPGTGFDGGAIYNEGDSVTANDVNFASNQVTTGNGAAIYSENGSLDINNALFDSNTGNGIVYVQSGTANLSQTRFSNNNGILSHFSSSTNALITDNILANNNNAAGYLIENFGNISIERLLAGENDANLIDNRGDLLLRNSSLNAETTHHVIATNGASNTTLDFVTLSALSNPNAIETGGLTGSVLVHNSIILDAGAANCPPEATTNWNIDGVNFASSLNCGGFTTASTTELAIETNASNNPAYIFPGANSIARDAAPSCEFSSGTPLFSDFLGQARPAGVACDVGAFEIIPDICGWHGIGCESGKVESINLENNGLQGSIPPVINAFSNLRTLNLSRNDLRGSLPPTVSELASLQTLDLSNNLLTGIIPSEIGNLNALINLDLSDNSFDGAIPPETGNLPALETLNLSANLLTGDIPLTIGNLSGLRVLNLRDNAFTENIPTSLSGIGTLEYLDLSLNRLEGTLPDFWGSFSNLQSVFVSSNQLSGDLPPSFEGLLDTTAHATFANLDIAIEYNNLRSINPLAINILDWQLVAQASAATNVQATTDINGGLVHVTWTPVRFQPVGGYYAFTFIENCGLADCPVVIPTPATVPLSDSSVSLGGIIPGREYTLDVTAVYPPNLNRLADTASLNDVTLNDFASTITGNIIYPSVSTVAPNLAIGALGNSTATATDPIWTMVYVPSVDRFYPQSINDANCDVIPLSTGNWSMETYYGNVDNVEHFYLKFLEVTDAANTFLSNYMRDNCIAFRNGDDRDSVFTGLERAELPAGITELANQQVTTSVYQQNMISNTVTVGTPIVFPDNIVPIINDPEIIDFVILPRDGTEDVLCATNTTGDFSGSFRRGDFSGTFRKGDFAGSFRRGEVDVTVTVESDAIAPVVLIYRIDDIDNFDIVNNPGELVLCDDSPFVDGDSSLTIEATFMDDSDYVIIIVGNENIGGTATLTVDLLVENPVIIDELPYLNWTALDEDTVTDLSAICGVSDVTAALGDFSGSFRRGDFSGTFRKGDFSGSFRKGELDADVIVETSEFAPIIIITTYDIDGNILDVECFIGDNIGDFTANSFTFFEDNGYGIDIYGRNAIDTDGDGAARFNFRVNPLSHDPDPNQAPIAIFDVYTMDEDDASLVVPAVNGVLANDSDPDGDVITTILAGETSHGIITLNADGSFTYTPQADFTGTDVFSYYNTDGIDNSDTVEVSIVVQAINDAPTLIVAGNQTTDNASDLIIYDALLISDVDMDADTNEVEVTLSVSQGVISLASVNGLSFTDGDAFTEAAMTFRGLLSNVNTAVSTLTYRTSNGFIGLDDITILVDDRGNIGGSNLTANAIIPINIVEAPENQAPIIDPIPDLIVSEDEVIAPIVVSATDPDDDNISFVVTGLPLNLSFDAITNTISGITAVGSTGVYNVSVTATDDGITVASSSISFQIIVQSDPPTIEPILAQIGNDCGLDTVSLAIVGSDAETAVRFDDDGTLPPGLSIDPLTGLISGIVSSGASINSPYTVTITVIDGTGNTASQTFSWTISLCNQPPPGCVAIDFHLLDANTDIPITTLVEGIIIDLANIGTNSFNIEAATTGFDVGSVAFELTGARGYVNVENVAPFSLYGDDNGDYRGQALPVGEYTMIADVFTNGHRDGNLCASRTINFTLIDSINPAPPPPDLSDLPQITGFLLINADNDTVIANLSDGDIIDRDAIGTSNINIVAETAGEVGSVIFSDDFLRIENTAPYAVAGDSDGDYNAIAIENGNYILSATAYTEHIGNGIEGIPVTISFTVTGN